jgi:hypothetical protein
MSGIPVVQLRFCYFGLRGRAQTASLTINVLEPSNTRKTWKAYEAEKRDKHSAANFEFFLAAIVPQSTATANQSLTRDISDS